MTRKLYAEDPYRQATNAKLVAMEAYDDTYSAIITDQTLFFPQGGGQPSDKGSLNLVNLPEDRGARAILEEIFPLPVENVLLERLSPADTPPSAANIAINTLDPSAANVKAPQSKERIRHLIKKEHAQVLQPYLLPGTMLALEIDFTHRYRLMRMHTSLHLLCAALPYAVTGGAIRLAKSHLDFSTAGQPLDKTELTATLNAYIKKDYAVTTHYVAETVFAATRAAIPALVRTAKVNPPADADGNIRLVRIGTAAGENHFPPLLTQIQPLLTPAPIDLQACGGTHVRSTAEINEVTVVKVENKGRNNRRVRIVVSD